MKRIITLLAAATLSVSTAFGTQSDTTAVRPVNASYTLRAGSAHIADTYLTPIKYSGWNVGVAYQRIQAAGFAPDRWLLQLGIALDAQGTMNPVQSSRMWSGALQVDYAMIHRWRWHSGLSFGVGPQATLIGGVRYLNRNGNNPASARAAFTFNITGFASWHTHIGHLPVTLRYQPSLPVIGVFFSPDYGELYYEISLGNHSGLAHCAWWGHYFRIHNDITLDLHFGSTALRLGYQGMYESTKVNNIVTRTVIHSAVVGVSGDWLSLPPRESLSATTRIITAGY